jgi:hypothetical protein
MKRTARYSAPAWVLAISLIAAAGFALLPITAPAADERPFLPKTIVSSTVPENGDVNPYGVALYSGISQPLFATVRPPGSNSADQASWNSR